MKRSLTPILGYRHPSASAWQAGCGCEQCKAYRRRKAKLRKMYGSSKVDAKPVIQKVEQLAAEGYSRQAIATAAGISPRSLFQATLTARQTVWRRTHDALMDLTRADIIRNSTPTSMVPAVGASRRLQALMRMGWRMKDIAADSTEIHMINKVRTTDPGARIMVRNFLRIAAMYDRFAMEEGPCKINRTKAEKFGYAPPLGWDDSTIDDPNARPDTTGMPQVSRDHPRHQQILALHGQGLSDRKIAAAIGVTGDAVRYWRLRIGLTPNTPGRSIALGDEPDDRYRLWQDGHSDQQIADKTGKHPDLIRKWRRRHGLEAAGRWPAA